MSQVSMQQVKELRERTQAGLNDCRSALMEADGDMDKAIEIILKKGLAKSAKRAGAIASEGVVVAKLAADAKSGVLVEVNIQTDFAARNEEFVGFAAQVAEVALATPSGAELGAQPFPGGGTVEERRAALVGKLGENITVRRWQRIEVSGAGLVQAYVHMGGKIGALLAVAAPQPERAEVQSFAEDVVMHVAAMGPLRLSAAESTEEEKAKQAEIFAAQVEEEGKVPEARRAQVVADKVAKWVKEFSLLEQPSVTDGTKTVQQLCEAVSAAVGGEVKILGFARFERGEGISKPVGDDFAAEVARMAGA